jgi:ribonuclease HI
MIFTTKKHGSHFNPIDLHGKTLRLVDSTKYLGLIIDKKLNFTEHINYCITKAQKALWATRGMVARNWGLLPKRVLWIYQQIVIPRISYGAVAFWHRATTIKTNVAKLTKIQRMALIMVTGAMHGTPTAALQTALNITPLDIKIKVEAISAYWRLKLNGNWLCQDALEEIAKKGHCDIKKLAHRIGQPNEEDGSPVIQHFEPLHKTYIGEREDWHKALRSTHNPIVFWSDGSKMEGRSALGIHCEELNISHSYRANDNNTIMQVEVHAIQKCVEEILQREIRGRNVVILSDSQAALKALRSTQITSHTVNDCLTKIKQLNARNNMLTLSWVPAHQGIAGNEKADELAKLGIINVNVDCNLRVPSSIRDDKIEKWESLKSAQRWDETPEQRVSKLFMSKPCKERAENLLKLSRIDLRVAIGILTGHCCLKKFLYRIHKSSNDRCRHCGVEPETSLHFLTSCTKLDGERFTAFKTPDLSEGMLKKLSISNILKFGRLSKIRESFLHTGPSSQEDSDADST